MSAVSLKEPNKQNKPTYVLGWLRFVFLKRVGLEEQALIKFYLTRIEEGLL